MSCLTATDPEPMMTESLISLLSHGVRMQAVQRASAPPPPRPQNPPQPQRQETPEERRQRIRGVLANALKITEDLLDEDEGNEIDDLFQDFGDRDRQ